MFQFRRTMNLVAALIMLTAISSIQANPLHQPDIASIGNIEPIDKIQANPLHQPDIGPIRNIDRIDRISEAIEAHVGLPPSISA